jgi:hypothetical protein
MNHTTGASHPEPVENPTFFRGMSHGESLALLDSRLGYGLVLVRSIEIAQNIAGLL